MTLITGSAPFQGVNMSALDLRRYIAAMVQTEGVGSSADMAVAQRAAGANMSVDIAAGEALVQGDNTTYQGFYWATNDATFNLTGFSAAHATLPRIDRVVLRVADTAHGGGSNLVSFAILTGTATAGATLANTSGAATPGNNELVLANVLIPATATTITTANIDTTGASNNSPPVRPTLTMAGAVPSGSELAYTQVTSDSSTTAGTEAAPTDWITAAAITTNATDRVVVEVFIPGYTIGTGPADPSYTPGSSLWDGATHLHRIHRGANAGPDSARPIFEKFILTPGSGSHTYKVRTWKTNNNEHYVAGTGLAGAGTVPPAYIRVTKA